MSGGAHKRADRHWLWQIVELVRTQRKWWPAITDDFGNLVPINITRAHHSLLSGEK